MAKKKFYAVAAGRKTGIFTDWSITEQQVKGFRGAKYKSFATLLEAESWLKNPVQKKATRSKSKKTVIAAQELPDDCIVIYTDGGSINNPGPGGYGIVILDGDNYRELSGGFSLTTNNRMEMMAAIIALGEVNGVDKPVILHSDSSYLVNGINKGWARKWRTNGWLKSDKKPALNRDLWEKLLEIVEDARVTFRWVKGHAGNQYNERCDRLAVTSAKKAGLPKDFGYTPDK